MKKTIIVLSLYLIPYTAYSIHPSSVRADWLLDRSGVLLKLDSSVLGDNDEQEVEDSEDVEVKVEEKRPENKQEDRKVEVKREQEQKAQEQMRERAKQNLERTIKQNEINAIRSKDKRESEIEVDGDKIKIKQKIKDANGRETETQMELDKKEKLQIESRDGRLEKKLRVELNDKGRMEIIQNKSRVRSDFALKVGEKNEISVTLPSGKVKEIKIPDQALENLISKGIIQSTSDASGSASYELVAGKNGEPVYQANGQVEKKLLGLFKMKFAQKIDVAAGDSEDGTTVAGDIVGSETLETTPWRRFLERIAR